MTWDWRGIYYRSNRRRATLEVIAFSSSLGKWWNDCSPQRCSLYTNDWHVLVSLPLALTLNVWQKCCWPWKKLHVASMYSVCNYPLLSHFLNPESMSTFVHSIPGCKQAHIDRFSMFLFLYIEKPWMKTMDPRNFSVLLIQRKPCLLLQIIEIEYSNLCILNSDTC